MATGTVQGSWLQSVSTRCRGAVAERRGDFAVGGGTQRVGGSEAEQRGWAPSRPAVVVELPERPETEDRTTWRTRSTREGR